MKGKKHTTQKQVFSYHKLTIILTIVIIALLFMLWNSLGNYEIPKIKLNLVSNNENRFEVTSLLDNRTLREYNLTAKEENYSIYENHSAKTYLYNSQLPGEIIRAKVGDTLKVNLKNELPESTTIHWHGMQLPNNMDGVPGVTQDSIKPGENFTYQFQVKNPGIYWYHPHYQTAHQIEMGLYGPLIVDDRNKSEIKSDKDIVIMLDDVRLDNNYQISQGLSGMDVMHGRYGNAFLINGKSQFNFEAEKGSIVRLRLINPSNARVFNYGIEGHELMVIGKGIDFLEKPYMSDIITIAPGQRYDVLVYIKESGNISYFTQYLDSKYSLGNIEVTKTSNIDKKQYFDSLQSKTLNSNLPNWNYLLNKSSNFTFQLIPSNIESNFQWTINGKSSNYGDEKVNLTEGKLYKFTFVNPYGQPHPIHIHGQKFIVLSRNGDEVKDKGYQDTILVNGGERVDIAFIAEGKGDWVAHCHILEHAEAGMLMELLVN